LLEKETVILATLKIISDDDPTLRKASREVGEITPRILRLLDDMIDTMHKYDGCGLAAPQVGVLRRVAVVEVEPGTIYELIDPVIVAEEGTQEEIEGCLSLPERWGITRRPAKVTVRAKNRARVCWHGRFVTRLTILTECFSPTRQYTSLPRMRSRRCAMRMWKNNL
jgi:peptide deformylase